MRGLATNSVLNIHELQYEVVCVTNTQLTKISPAPFRISILWKGEAGEITHTHSHSYILPNPKLTHSGKYF